MVNLVHAGLMAFSPLGAPAAQRALLWAGLLLAAFAGVARAQYNYQWHSGRGTQYGSDA